MEGTLIFLPFVAVVAFIAWAMRQRAEASAQQADKESMESLANVEITYDKFQDETTLMSGSRLKGDGPPYPSFLVMAFHSGAAVADDAKGRLFQVLIFERPPMPLLQARLQTQDVGIDQFLLLA